MSTPKNREELEQLKARHQDVVHESVTRVLGGRVSETGVLFSKDRLEYEGDHGPETLDIYWTPLCDFGHLLGTDGNAIAGRCTICRRLTCSQCTRTCVRGHVV